MTFGLKNVGAAVVALATSAIRTWSGGPGFRTNFSVAVEWSYVLKRYGANEAELSLTATTILIPLALIPLYHSRVLTFYIESRGKGTFALPLGPSIYVTFYSQPLVQLSLVPPHRT